MQLPQYAAHADMEERHWWFLARRLILATLLHELLPPSKTTRLIDVGCGTGGLTHFLSNEYTVTGIDPSSDAIAFAQKRFPQNSFVHGHAPQDLADEFHRADGILLIEVLEHIEDDVGFVHRLIDAMQPGAFLVMMAPADMSLWGPHDDAFEHFRRYEGLDDFRRLWVGTPMKELLVSYCNRRLYSVVKGMRKMSAFRGKSWGKGGTDIDVPMAPVNAVLRAIYEGEAQTLLRALRVGMAAYTKGVTVIAVLRKA